MPPTNSLNPAPSRRKHSKLLLLTLLFGATILLTLVISRASNGNVFQALEHLVSTLENRYQQWLGQQQVNNPAILLPLAFAGGLIASISPCILALLPVNLSYIGTLEVKSRWDAFVKAGGFVLGVVTVLSLFGLFSSFTGIVLVQLRGYIHLAIGAIILVMGLSLGGVIRLPLPQRQLELPIAGSYGVGLTFALVSSPCASPVLFAVLATAAASGSPIFSTLTMVSYALGYSAIIFLASFSTGLVKQTRTLLHHSQLIIRLSSVALIVAGAYYLIEGVRWFL